jgi:hypothetical protein
MKRSHKPPDKCDIRGCEVCKLVRRMNRPAPRNKYLLSAIPAAPGQLELPGVRKETSQ